jgi:hypothetical protein
LTQANYPAGVGDNNFLQKQLARAGGDKAKSRLARIYAFSYEGNFYVLDRPTIFVVHGPGREVDPPGNRPIAGGGIGVAAHNRTARAPGPIDDSGVAAQAYSFADDLMFWTYDKDDFSLRLDVESGPLARILLEAELVAPEAMVQSSGMMARSSGMMARSSGMMARSSGMMARSSGMMARRGRGGDGLD